MASTLERAQHYLTVDNGTIATPYYDIVFLISVIFLFLGNSVGDDQRGIKVNKIEQPHGVHHHPFHVIILFPWAFEIVRRSNLCERTTIKDRFHDSFAMICLSLCPAALSLVRVHWSASQAATNRDCNFYSKVFWYCQFVAPNVG